MGTLNGASKTVSLTNRTLGSVNPLSDPAKNQHLQIKYLILRAWRERWSNVKWGIYTRSIQGFKNSSDAFIADAILQEALNGPGPNSKVLSYLMHSVFSKVISIPTLLKSISQYDGYHKPFCVMSLVEILERIKDCLINETDTTCLELGSSLAAVIHWLLTCMYSSLENLLDLNEYSPETEHTKIVKRCSALITYLMSNPYLNSLMHVSVLHETVLLENLKRMTNELIKFEDSQNKPYITAVKSVMDTFTNQSANRGVQLECKEPLLKPPPNGSCGPVVNACVETIIIGSALRQLSSQMFDTANEIITIKKLKNISPSNVFCDIIQSAMIGLVDAIGTCHELRFTGYVFFKLPSLLCLIRDKIAGEEGDFVKGLELFLENDCTMETIDSKLHCNALELLLTSFQKAGLLTESSKSTFLNKKGSTQSPQKVNSSNVVILLKAEATLLSILKTLDGHGDYGKNQDSILSVLSDMMGKSFQLILTAASATGRLSLLIAKLIKLNQCSRQVIGEAGKASTTRAMIFDISFLMLCNIAQQYGHQVIQSGDSDCFFEEWCRECMVEEGLARDHSTILARCDQSKVDLLLAQYLQGDSELKTSLIFWHELCTNSVGVVNYLLLGWESNSLSEADVKKVLDVLRSKTCCLPICIATWLCAYMQIMPHERCEKANEILQHLLTPVKYDESQDKFSERHSMMSDVINKMLECVKPETSEPEKQTNSTSTTKGTPKCATNTDLFKKCWVRLRKKSNVDLETIVDLKHLLQINGPVQFVSSCIHELVQLQHGTELTHWRDMFLGVFHIELLKCTEALLSCVLPTCLILAARDQNFVEPQIQALVTLTVDCILSCYNMLTESKDTNGKEDDDTEPKAKRARLMTSKSATEMETDGLVGFNKVLGAMYHDFSKTLGPNQAGPHVVFIVSFFKELLQKVDTREAVWLNLLPLHMMERLMPLRSELQPEKILAMADLSTAFGREKCANLICALKRSQVNTES